MAVRVHYHMTSLCRTRDLQPVRWHENVKKNLRKMVGWLAFWMKVTYVKLFVHCLSGVITPQIEKDINLVCQEVT